MLFIARRKSLLVCMFLSSILTYASAQDAMEIELQLQTASTLQGILVVPEGNLYQMLKAEKQEKIVPDASASSKRASTIGAAGGTWIIRRFNPGRYSFFVSDLLGDDDLPATLAWSEKVASIRVKINGVIREFKPKPDAQGQSIKGRVWHAFDLDGSTGEISETNYIFPYRKMVYGLIRDSLTGLGVPGVKVSLSNASGRVVEETETDGSGIYALFPSAMGVWKLAFSKKDLISVERTVQYLSAEAPQRFDLAVSQRLAASQIRAVLSWNKYPADLDLHILGPGKPAETVHISYENMKQYNAQYFLDRDDKDGYGPETITLNKPSKGIFVLSIHDYTNRKATGSGNLASSGASLTLYRGSEVLATLSVPSNAGTWWHALTFDETGALNMLNRVDELAPVIPSAAQ